MPKVEPLYNHSARKATTRQVNVSTSASGRSSYSYASSAVPVAPPPVPHPDHEYYEAAGMDIDDDEEEIPNEQPVPNETVEVVPGIHVHVQPTSKAKRYDNSVGIICRV